jgi:hypothetical protein
MEDLSPTSLCHRHHQKRKLYLEARLPEAPPKDENIIRKILKHLKLLEEPEPRPPPIRC